MTEAPGIDKREVVWRSNWNSSRGSLIIRHGDEQQELNVPIVSINMNAAAGVPAQMTISALCGGVDVIQEISEKNPLMIEIRHIPGLCDHEDRMVCPLCRTKLTRNYYRSEDGEWCVGWGCGCKPDPGFIKEQE
jgi:hypothetical protein